jgi:glycosyltransferase involved in cell wall biosynthesis
MIPAYNPDEKYLEQTLQSILKQDPGPERMQIEVVDDCSPDGKTERMVHKIAGERIAVRREPKNLGLARVWNRCIELAKGEYIHILHQDDWVVPGFYNALEKGLRQYTEAGAAFCRAMYCDENGKTRDSSRLEMPKPGVLSNLIETLVVGNCIPCASIVVKRTTYERLGGYNGELNHALDWEMWIRIANSFPIYYEPQILAAWRQHRDATTSKQIVTGQNTRDNAKAVRIWSQYLPPRDRQRLSIIARRQSALSALNLAEYLRRNGNLEGYRNQLQSASFCDPSPLIKIRAILLQLRFFFRPFVRWVLRRA